MTGWNMPPGCNVSDIPGNSAEDERLEILAARVETALEPLTILTRELAQSHPKYTVNDVTVESKEDEVVLALMKMLEEFYSTGRKDGLEEAALAEELEKDGEGL